MTAASLLAGLAVLASAGWQADSAPSAADSKSEGNDSKDVAAAESDSAPAPGNATLHEALRRLSSYQSVHARIVESVRIGSRQFEVEGQYLQGADNRLRLEYQVDVHELDASLLEVCDGQILWTRYEIGEERRVTRRDVNQILKAVGQGAPPAMAMAQLGLGGLPGLLASLERTMNFEAPQDETVDGRSFRVLQGSWKPEFLAVWQQGRKEFKATDRLPEYVPEQVRIYFNGETLFPQRIVYLKRRSESQTYRPMVTLDMTKVVLDGPVDPSQFSFVPSNESVDDITNIYIEQLKANKSAPFGSLGK